MNCLPPNPRILIESMKETDTTYLFEDLILFFLQKNLQENVLPKFFQDVTQKSCSKTLDAVESLYNSLLWYFNYIDEWHNAKAVKAQINQILKSILKWNVHRKVSESFAKLFAFAFQFYVTMQEGGNTDMSDADAEEKLALEWQELREEIHISSLTSLMEEKFKPMIQQWLVELELVEMFCDDNLMSVLEIEVNRYVVRTCDGNFEKRWIGDDSDELENWYRTKVMPWLDLIYHNGFDRTKWEQKLHYILYKSYTKLRISEMLNIITDYPESIPALRDLKVCAQHTRQRPRLIESLKNDIATRVLHPGVSTQNIITVYIAAVKALRELDLSGVVMEMVLEPCTTYLTQREDSVRMIMQGLLWDDGSNDLAAELAKTQEPDEMTCWNERVTDTPEDWLPDPREADPNKTDKSSRMSDIVTLFIGMYGSKEKFIREYQKLLSKRLLHTWCSEESESAEIRNLELLKRRFGEEDMSKCAVMLKDISDSKRINSYVKDEYSTKASHHDDIQLRTMIISSQFWPEISNQEFELPSSIAENFTHFNKGYENLKASRSLKWLSGVGMVDIELELEDRAQQFRVNPLQAAIIHHFQDKDEWTLSDLSDSLKIPPTVLRRKINFWLQQGIIKEFESDHYVTVENRETTSPSAGRSTHLTTTAGICDVTERFDNLCDDEDDDEKGNSEDEKLKEKNSQIFWNFIQGMLKNLESLPLDRIHKMLQMFATHDSDMQIEMADLRQLLNDKVQKGMLVIEQGKYKLIRDTS